MRLWSELKPALFAGAPFVGAALTLAAGVMLLISGATPSVPDHFMVVWDHTPAFLIETSHFLSSVMGLALVMLAFGLRARLGGAWAATMAALLVAAPLALLKGFVWEESTALLVLAVLLSPFRAAFPRESQLTRMEITPGWLFSAFAVLLGAGLVGLWSFQHADYGDQPFWKTMVDADAARSPSASGGCWPRRRRRRSSARRTRISTRFAPYWPAPRRLSRARISPCSATSASCSRPRATAS